MEELANNNQNFIPVKKPSRWQKIRGWFLGLSKIKKTILVVGVLVILSLAVLVSAGPLGLVDKKDTGTAQLYISSPVGEIIKPGEKYTMDVMLDSQIDDVVAVQLVLKYDEGVFDIDNFDYADGWIAGGLTDASGEIKIILGTPGNNVAGDGTQTPRGTGFKGSETKIFSFDIQAFVETDPNFSAISFGPETSVLNDVEAKEILKNFEGYEWIVKQDAEYNTPLSITDGPRLETVDLTAGKVKVNWQTNLPADSQVCYCSEDQVGINGVDFAKCNQCEYNGEKVKEHVMYIDSLDKDLQYYYQVRSQLDPIVRPYDPYEPQDENPENFSHFKLIKTAQAQTTEQIYSAVIPFKLTHIVKDGLEIYNLSAVPSYTSVSILWNTQGGDNDGNTTGSVLCEEIQSGGKEKTETDNVLSTSHIVRFIGLSPNSQYFCKVTAIDGNKEIVEPIYFKTNQTQQPDANIALKVSPDRECDKWLYCRSSIQVPGSNNQTQNLCFDIGICDEKDVNGECVSTMTLGDLNISKVDQTFLYPDEVASVKNLSGLSKVGLDWGNNKVVDGYNHYGNMTATGIDITIPNGGFELGEEWPWETTGGQLEVVRDEQSDMTNRVLKIMSDGKIGDGWVNARVPIGYIKTDQSYSVSLGIKLQGSNSKKVKIQFWIPDESGKLTVASIYNLVPEKDGGGINVTSNWQTVNLISPKFNNAKDGSPSYLNIGITKNDLKDAAILIDNVSMKSALQVSKELSVNRTCRLYPSSSALACDYTDATGKQYLGWKGFCVEPDPKYYSADESKQVCLNWWPVDILPGETDIFGTDQQAGYVGRAPLYYCLESSGNYPYYKREIKGYFGKETNWQETYNVSYLNIYRDEILEISVDNVEMDQDDDHYNSDDCNVIAVHESGVQDTQSVPQSSSQKQGTLIFNQANEQCWENDLITSYTKDGEHAKANACIALRCSGKGAKNDTMNITGKLEFNDVTDKLESVIIKGQDPAGNDGHIKFSGIHITYLGERCEVLAQVVTPDGRNSAWSNRVKGNDKTYNWTQNNYLDYAYNQDLYPYGAAVVGAPVTDPSQWKYPLYVMPKIEDQYGYTSSVGQARAGAPYSITSKTGSKITCVSPSDASKIGDSCSGVDSQCDADGKCEELSSGVYGCTEGVLKDGYTSCYAENETTAEMCVGGPNDGVGCSPDGSECWSGAVGNCSINGCGQDEKLVDFPVCISGLYSVIGNPCDLNNGNDDCKELDVDGVCAEPTNCIGNAVYELVDNGNGILETQLMGMPDKYLNKLCMAKDSYGICDVVDQPGPVDSRCVVKGSCGAPSTTDMKAQCVAGSAEKLGTQCNSSADCGYNYSDTSQSGLCMGINLTDEQQSIISGDWQTGQDRLSELFAESYGVWRWALEDGEMKYVKQTVDDKGREYNWDITSEANSIALKPKVLNIQISNKTSGVVSLNGPKRIYLKFNSQVDPNHLPLTAYRVDWGDGTPISQVDNLRISDRPVVYDQNNKIDNIRNRPHILFHTYECKEESTCVYVPKVQIQDNWGICNNAISGTGGKKCDMNSDGWEVFKGTVEVEP